MPRAPSHAGPAGAATEHRYRQRWTWERVAWGTHCVGCYGACPYRVYVRDGRVAFEEPAGAIPTVEARVPDLNPMSCQKGSAWSTGLEGADRILSPLRRVGERGSGAWERISWDEALDDIADAILDAIDEDGPESIVIEETSQGGLLTQGPLSRFAGLLGAVTLDVNGLNSDFAAGQHITFGKVSGASSVDDTFLSELVIVWHANPAYTSIPYYHFLPEARYRGARVVTIAPDYSPSALAADLYVPVRPGSDAALALGLAAAIVDADLVDVEFVTSQTDLPLLVRADTQRFLRGADLVPGGGDDTFFVWRDGGAQPASRGSLLLDDGRPELVGRWSVVLGDGAEVPVTTVYELLRARLADYSPERAGATCGVEPGVIRELARAIASRRTKVMEGFNAAKYFHGDLMERAMALVLALTGNWGRPGTGLQGITAVGLDGHILFQMKGGPGSDQSAALLDGLRAFGESLRAADPDTNEELAANEMLQMAVTGGSSTPAALFDYEHAGASRAFDREEWRDASMPRPFAEHLRDARQRGWWGGLLRPDPDTEPRVLLCTGTNPLRRARGGRRRLLEELWPKLQTIVAVDFRMTSTALHADIVLPAAMHYERENLQFPFSYSMHLAYSEAAVDPPGEARTDWRIFRLLTEHVEERAAARGMVEFLDGRRQTHRFDRLVATFTRDGAFETDEAAVAEIVRNAVDAGTLPEGTSVETLRTTGSARFSGLGAFAPGLAFAADIDRGTVATAWTRHVERGDPFPTLTRRAQFYVDHPWFLEADEALPRHKEPPPAGGVRRFTMTGGHARWSIHSSAMGNDVLLQTHRGRPFVTLNDRDAASLGIGDGDEVEVGNDYGAFRTSARVSPRVRPGQVIAYNGFEPHMHPGWEGANEVEPGLVKWLHLVGRYGHLTYRPAAWQPTPSDRGLPVDVERVR